MIVRNIDEWNAYAPDSNVKPTEFPVVAWLEQFDAGLMGGASFKFFRVIPSKETEGGTEEAWCGGFKAGKDL